MFPNADSGEYLISIHAAREGGDGAVVIVFLYTFCISIHAAREGGDYISPPRVIIHAISIHAAREGGDQRVPSAQRSAALFQSTPPVKAATAETNRRNQHFRKQQV